MAFVKMCKLLKSNPQVDRFASPHNHKLPRFNSRWPHPRAEAVNSMTIDWGMETNYWAPPLPLLDRVVQKIQVDQASGILITPPWARPWLPTLVNLADRVLRLPAEEFRPQSAFELKSEFLLAWRICGKGSCATSLRNNTTWWSQIASLKDWQLSSAP